MRREFAALLLKEAKKNPNIILLVGDLGFGMWDEFRETLPEQFINTGAAESTLLDMAVGMAYEGKIPFCYSITPFILARPYETIRIYINQEKPHLVLLGSGRDSDYAHDGFTHHAFDAIKIMENFENVDARFPEKAEDLEEILYDIFKVKKPYFLSLKR